MPATKFKANHLGTESAKKKPTMCTFTNQMEPKMV